MAVISSLVGKASANTPVHSHSTMAQSQQASLIDAVAKLAEENSALKTKVTELSAAERCRVEKPAIDNVVFQIPRIVQPAPRVSWSRMLVRMALVIGHVALLLIFIVGKSVIAGGLLAAAATAMGARWIYAPTTYRRKFKYTKASPRGYRSVLSATTQPRRGDSVTVFDVTTSSGVRYNECVSHNLFAELAAKYPMMEPTEGEARAFLQSLHCIDRPVGLLDDGVDYHMVPYHTVNYYCEYVSRMRSLLPSRRF